MATLRSEPSLPPTPEELAEIRGVREGSEAFLRALIARYERRIFSATFHMVGDREVAREVTQDVFVLMWRKLDQYQDGTNFPAWLYTIARNLCASRARTAARRDATRPSETAEMSAEEEPPIEDSAGASLLAQRLEAFMLTREPAEREVFDLFIRQGMSQERAAEIMKITVAELKNILKRVRRAIRPLLPTGGGP